MVLKTDQTTHQLACCGLSFYENEMVRLVIEVLTHRLAHVWQWVSSEKADVWVIDPRHTDKSLGSNDRGEDIVVIPVLEPGDARQATRGIYRPLSPRELIDALNDVDIDQPIARTSKPPGLGESPNLVDWRPMSLVEAFRVAAKSGQTGVVVQIEGIGDQTLVVDAERDRVYGSLDSLTLDQFASEAQFQARLVSRWVAEDIMDQSTERQLGPFLIELANTGDTHQCLFGDIYRSKIQLNPGSDLSELPIEPGAIQAATRIRQASYTLVKAAELDGVDLDELLTLFNALYINGMLDVVEQDSDEGDVPPEARSPHPASSPVSQDPPVAKDVMPARPALDLTELCQRQIDAMRDNEHDIVYASIASLDGYEMVSACAQGWEISFNRLVDMAKSGQALGVNVFEDLVQGRCHDVSIETEELDIVFQSVPKLESPPLMLGVAATKSMGPDRVLESASYCVESISNTWFENFQGPITARK